MTEQLDTYSLQTLYDVIIVGAGPVGLGLAIELGQRGVAVMVLERSIELHEVPRGQNLTQRTGEHFRAWGILDEIEAASPIPRSFGNAGLVAYGTLLGDYHYDWFKRGSVAEYYHAANQRLPQYLTEKVLRERVAELENITIRYGVKVDNVSQGEDHAQVEFIDDGERQSLTAHFVVGCDGSRSIVRQAAGIEQEIDPHDRKMVLLVFQSKELHNLLERFPGKSIYNVLNPELDGYWQFLGRVDLDGNWFYHAPVPHDTTVDNFDFAAYLHEAVGDRFEIDFHHIGFWNLRISTATRYRNKRLIIAGDAAHSHPPYGGYGVNTGFEDARNLGWKLAAYLKGCGGENLLDSYDAERRPVFTSTSKNFIGRMIEDDRAFSRNFNPNRDRSAFEAAWQERALCGNADVTQFLPHYSGSPIVQGGKGETGARGEHMTKARAGHHLAPSTLADGRDIFSALGHDACLICLPPSNASLDISLGAARDEAKRLDLPVKILHEDNASLRTKYECSYILVRPDHFIAWIGDDAPGDWNTLFSMTLGKGAEA